MNIIIPFEKKLDFKNQIKEICSISLEHEITQNDTEVLGNFLISGSYKEHELSLNLSEFDFTVPFSVELENRIDTDTLEFSIDNFTYEIKDKEMLVKIDYILRAEEIIDEKKPVELERIEVPELETIVKEIEIKDEPNLEEEIVFEEETTNQEQVVIKEEENKEPIRNLEEYEESREDSICSLTSATDDYITYHVHIVKKEETIEQIALNYKLEKEEILKINDITMINENEKILIPISNE